MGKKDEDLVQGVVRSMQESIGSRHVAADVLRKVAELGSSGNFPSDVTCEQLGRALFRIAMNAPDEDPLLSILNGYRAAEREWHERLEQTLRGR